MRFIGTLLIGSLACLQAIAAEPPTLQEWQAVVDKAATYLKGSQRAAGEWGDPPRNMGISGIVVTGLLNTGTPPDAEPAARGLAYIESLINVKDGHIAGQAPVVGLKNYVTSVNIMALSAAKRDDKYRAAIGNAADFLRKLQWDDGEKIDESSDFYGGAGYDSKNRPDLSNTQFFLDALTAAGASKSDPAFRKALVFVSRCQNFKSEHNDQPWAGTINDGSFIYSAAGGGSTRTTDEPGSTLDGYGSMTYAGVKSMIYCGVSKDDPRILKALEWIRKNYTVDANPGMPPQRAQMGLYYYYHTMAKTLALLEMDKLTDNRGVEHDWRADLFRALQKRQRPDGSWKNDSDRWMEGDPDLVTGYALMALAYCKPRQ